MRPLLILRPEPGAGRTAARAQALGLEPVVAPLFVLEQRSWRPPDPSAFDCVLLTSANSVRLAGPGLKPFLDLPAVAVGAATAAAALEAGFASVEAGPSDLAAALDLAQRRGLGALFHPCGTHHRALDRPGLRIERIAVYESVAHPALAPRAIEALAGGAVALLHSPRAAELFRALIGAAMLDRSRIAIAAISPACAAAAGSGWASISAAERPTDQAMLELAEKLCKTGDAPNGK